MAMESKHFSHQHPLVLHQVLQGSLIHCSGCNSPASGNVYMCWQCSYFLHEQCFRAARSLHHPSHPLHPLSLAPLPTHPSSSFLCNSCNLAGHGFSYTCSHCDFDLHLHCALTNHIQNHPQSQTTTNNQTPHHHMNPPLCYPIPNATPPTADPPPQLKHFSHPHVLKQTELDDETTTLCSACGVKLSGASAYCCTQPYCSFSLDKSCFDSPREVRHKSHPHHPLNLLPAPPYTNGSFTCRACRTAGKAYTYTCTTCSYDLHVDCIRWPEKLTRPDHKHPLALYCGSPFAGESGGAVFVCDACGETADDKAWVYYCRECDFGTHVGYCVKSEIKPQAPQSVAGGGEQLAKIRDELISFHEQKMALDIQMQMAKQYAEFMATLWKN